MINEIPIPQLIRLRTIEIILDNYGSINRNIICQLFSIGVAHASLDLKLYRKLNQDSVFYNRVLGRIEKSIDFKRVIP